MDDHFDHSGLPAWANGRFSQTADVFADVLALFGYRLDLYFYHRLPDGGPMKIIRTEEKGTGKFYLLGFFLCIVLTLAAYFLVVEKLLSGVTLILVILGLGVIQMAVQLVFFMHLGSEYADGKPKHHWNFLVFFFMIMVLVIIVFGSLWIMYTLNYREMPPMNLSQ